MHPTSLLSPMKGPKIPSKRPGKTNVKTHAVYCGCQNPRLSDLYIQVPTRTINKWPLTNFTLCSSISIFACTRKVARMVRTGTPIGTWLTQTFIHIWANKLIYVINRICFQSKSYSEIIGFLQSQIPEMSVYYLQFWYHTVHELNCNVLMVIL